MLTIPPKLSEKFMWDSKSQIWQQQPSSLLFITVKKAFGGKFSQMTYKVLSDCLLAGHIKK